ncbi:MAG TPA: T9SS type A sorting domain-containing protein [Candidatus Kapabacteria bacterium]|nr:T9SS type A sorting domain-containing protein [Candidatus Kapabacteria bacterium]
MKHFIIALVLVSFCINPDLFSQEWLDKAKDPNNFFSIQKSFYDIWGGKDYQKGTGYKQFKRWEYFWRYRVDKDGNFPDAREAYKSYLKFLKNQNQDNFLAQQKEWKELGPNVIPTSKLSYSSSGVGRINVVRINPNNDNDIWIGAATGGVWKSSDKGKTWSKMGWTDIMSIGVSDIALAPSDPNIIYAATGDKDGHFQNNPYSIGLMKSTNGGKTWSVTSLEAKKSESFLITKILVDNDNPDKLIVATSRGIMKSSNGGANWEIKINGFYRDLEYHPTNKNIIYSVSSGLYSYHGGAGFFKSVDGGETWQKIFDDSNLNRLEIGISPANPDYVYLLGATKGSGSYAGVWRSNNAGNSFDLMSNSPNILSIDANGAGNYGQGFYDLTIAVNPVNAEEIYIGGIHIWKSSNGGKNWTLINHWMGVNKPYVHADQHYLLFNPTNLNLYSANDGGLYVSTNNGITWNDLSNGLSIAQFYRISVANSPDLMISGGTQDNGTHLLSGGNWYNVNGGDGMETHINPLNSNIVFCTTQNGSVYRSNNGGMNFQYLFSPSNFDNEVGDWVTPFELNPQKPSSLIIGYKDVYRSYDNGSWWHKISNFGLSSPLNLLAYSPTDSNYIYAIVGSTIFGTYDGGSNWQTIGVATGAIQGIAVDYDDPRRFWVAVSTFQQNNQVFEFNGKNRTNISYNLPALPATSIITVKNSAGKLVIGTDIGIYYKEPISQEWKTLGSNMPPVLVSDIEVNYTTGKIYAATFGRGIFENEIFGCQITEPEIKADGKLEFCYGDSVKLSLIGNYKNFLWSNGDSLPSITVYNSGSYYVTITDESGCSARSKVIDVNVKDADQINVIVENNGYLCGKDSLQLTIPIGIKNYIWNTGETSRKIWVKKPGKYYATATATNGCQLFSQIIDIQQGEIPAKPIIEKLGNMLITDSGYSYVWYYNGATMNVADTNAIEISQNGDYQVEVFSKTSCSTLSDVIKVTTSVQDLVNSNIIISPNPTKDFVEISGKNLLGNTKVIVQNLEGQTLISKDFEFSTSNAQKLNLSKLSNGMYMIIIENQGKKYSEKIIKIK